MLGDEELLVERAVADVLRQARKQAGNGRAVNNDVPVDRLRAGDVSTSELAELLSPSLFAEERVVVLESAAEAGKDAVALIAEATADVIAALPPRRNPPPTLPPLRRIKSAGVSPGSAPHPRARGGARSGTI